MRICKIAVNAVAILVLALASGVSAWAQSGVVFIPSTHTQEKGKFHLSLETYHHFGRYEKGGFQSYGPALVYGVSKNVEAGINYYSTRNADGWTHLVEPNVKWRVHNNDDKGTAVAFGVLAFIPLNRRSELKDAAQFYAVASKVFKNAGELKLTGGVYAVATADRDFGTKTGVMAAVEKPITKKLSAMADWTSGNNALGTSNIGLSYKTKELQTLTFAYSFGNTGRGNNFFSAYYGIIF